MSEHANVRSSFFGNDISLGPKALKARNNPGGYVSARKIAKFYTLQRRRCGIIS